ncbi:unnamed protein product [Spirodela intermedia]|uniref:Uncharacterized protein n=1 Tax=Spirodela intermedia TaxID=51605 RepID=A0A7I8KP11_SPIIN|nr:unnamed protein product [Spirodela intermedia]
MEQNVPGSKVFQRTDLLVYLGKQHGTGKRSKRHKNENKKAGSVDCTNRFLNQDLNHDMDIFPPKQVDMPCLEKDASWDGDICCDIISQDLINSRFSQNELQERRPTLVESKLNSASQIDNSSAKSGQSDCFVRDNSISCEHSRSPNYEDFSPWGMNSPITNEMLGGFLDSNVKTKGLLAKAKDVNARDLHIPNVLDNVQDKVDGFSLVNDKGRSFSVKGKVVASTIMQGADAPKKFITEGGVLPNFLETKQSITERNDQIMECHPDVDTSAILTIEPQAAYMDGNRDPEFNRIDFSGNDLARSMMALLLPSAVPLLKKTYQRRMQKHEQRKKSATHLDQIQVDSTVGSDAKYKSNDFPSQGHYTESPINGAGQRIKRSLFHKVTVECDLGNDIGKEPLTSCRNSADVQFIVQDSFEDDQYAHDVSVVQKSLLGFDDNQPRLDSTHNSFKGNQLSQNDKCVRRQSDSEFGIDEDDKMGLACDGDPHKAEPLSNNSSSSCLRRKFNDTCVDKNEDILQSTHCFAVCTFEGTAALETCGIVHHNIPPLGAEVISGDVEETLHHSQPDIGAIRKRKAEYFAEVNPNFDGSVGVDERGADIRNAAVATYISFHGKTVAGCIEEDSCSLTETANGLASGGETHIVKEMTREQAFALQASNKYKVPFSESIICRDMNDGKIMEAYAAKRVKSAANRQLEIDSRGIDEKASLISEERLKMSDNICESIGLVFNAIAPAPQNREALGHSSDAANDLKFIHTDVKTNDTNPCSDNNAAVGDCHEQIPVLQVSRKQAFDESNPSDLSCSGQELPIEYVASDRPNDFSYLDLSEAQPLFGSSSVSMKPDEQLEDFVELIGCYLHPHCIRSILLNVKEGTLHVCTLCGPSEGAEGVIFVYQIPMKKEINFPSFLGYTSIMFPIRENGHHQSIPIERCGLQFTPDGEYLVFSNGIKAPSCREKKFRCRCSICKLDCGENNAINIVHLELGYVSTVSKLKTVQNIYCILVCESNHLLAVEESGSLLVWLMNPSWRSSQEEFILPGFDSMEPSAIELKQIPKCASIIVGHDGAGGFCLWDVSKRIKLSKFSTLGDVVSQVLPVGWLTNVEVSKTGAAPTGERAAIWFLVHGHRLEKESDGSSAGWRLGLLVNDGLFLGGVLDARVSFVGALSDLGIAGMSDGHVYMWELTTGTKLADLHPFTGGGGGISCIVADEKSGVFAVAGDGCELRIYLRSKMACPTPRR